MKLIIFDYEVFRFDTLLGTKIVDDGKIEYFQTWSIEAMQKFFELNKTAMWIGHNNSGYDNLILEACVNGKSPYEVSKKIVKQGIRPRCKLQFPWYDCMHGFYSLKSTELVDGKNISETEVDFDLPRPLTEEEKLATESYNRDDLDQTYDNFMNTYSMFDIRIQIIKEFNLPIEALNWSGTSIAAKVLGAKAIPGIENQIVEPKIYDTLQLKNEKLLDFYLNNKFRTKEKLSLTFCNCVHTFGAGGVHAALKKYHTDRAMYFDVSGYYNLIMLNLDLLPRTMPKESKELYRYMYFEQLKLKKVDPVKRIVYKTILLAVFGSMMNEYTDFYDPWNGLLVTISGQIFIADLLEKLEGLVQVIQSNTDGIILEPFDWNDRDKIIAIVEEWEERTGFVIKKEEVTNLYQRDVNNYCCLKDGEPVFHGEALNGFDSYTSKTQSPVQRQAWSLKEPAAIATGVANYLLYGKLPEDTIDEIKDDLRMFQFSCKKLSFDYLTAETISANGVTETRLQGVNRAFACNDKHSSTLLYKHKDRDGKHTKQKVACLPDNVFVYNDALKKMSDEQKAKIDFQYYIDRIYERITEFVRVERLLDLP